MLFERLVQVPLGSFTAKSRSLTRFVLAVGVLAGSVQDNAICKSGEDAPIEKLQPRSSDVDTESPSIQVVFIALRKSTMPQPSWLFGAVSPAPFVDEPYCPAISRALAVKIALTKEEFGSECPSLSIRC